MEAKDKEAKKQRNKETKEQRNKGTKEQRNKGTKSVCMWVIDMERRKRGDNEVDMCVGMDTDM